MKLNEKQTKKLAEATTKKLPFEEIIRKDAKTNGQDPDTAAEITAVMIRRYGFTPIRANNTVAMYKSKADDPETVIYSLVNADPTKLHIMNVYALLAAFKDMDFAEAITFFDDGRKGYGAFFPKYFSELGEIEDSEIPEFGDFQLTVDLDTFGNEEEAA